MCNEHAACCAHKGKMSRDESAQVLTQELGNSPAACQAKELNRDNWITVQYVSRPATNYRQQYWEKKRSKTHERLKINA